MNNLAPKSSVFIHRLAAVTRGVLSLVLLAALGGCKKHVEGDGHDHAASAESAHRTAHSSGASEARERGGAGDGEETHVDEVRLTADAIERYGVKVDSAHLRVLQPTLVAPARVAFNAETMAHVGTPLRGRVVEVKVRLGALVSEGQELVIVESPELGEAQADFFQRTAAVQSAGPAMDLAKAAWERARGLLEQSQSISLTEVQRREGEYRAAIANVRAAEAAAMASEDRLRLLGMSQDEVGALAATHKIAPRHAIKAAIGGRVVHREVTLGEIVGPDRDPLMVLADTSLLWVLADVPEAELAELVIGARAWVTIGGGGGVVDGEEARRFEGAVSFIAPIVDPTTRTAQVRIEMPVDELALRPGMFAQAEIVLSRPGGAQPAPCIAVPDEAIQLVEGGPAVFVPVPNESERFAKRSVTIGKRVGGLVPITDGLAEGERFVIAGTFILKAELGKGSAAHEH